MPSALAMHAAQRCTAKSKRTGLPCKSPAVRGWTVCRMHGAGGGAKPGETHPNYRHGERSADAAVMRKLVNALGREARELESAMESPELARHQRSKGG